MGSIRKGIVQAAWNTKAIKKFYDEAALICILVAVFTWSWFWTAAVIIFMSVVLLIPVLNIVYSVTVSLIYAIVVGGAMGYIFSAEAGWVCAFMSFIVSIGYHIAAIEYARDLTDPHDRNFY